MNAEQFQLLLQDLAKVAGLADPALLVDQCRVRVGGMNGAQHQPAAVPAADGGLPVATSIAHALELQRQGHEVKFHLPEDDKSWG